MEQSPSYLKSLKKESVVQSVINCLTDAMRNKELRPGDRIPPEPELAASLGVARSSVREAIKILTYLGVLESKRSEGTFVCSGFKESMIDPMVYGIILNQDSFEDLMELRQMIEAGTLRLAMRKYTEEEGQALEEILARMREIVESGEDVAERFFRIDDEFHQMISRIGKNPLADKLSRVVRTLTYAMRRKTVTVMIETGRGQELLETHAKQVEMLRSGRDASVSEVVREGYFSEVLNGEDV